MRKIILAVFLCLLPISAGAFGFGGGGGSPNASISTSGKTKQIVINARDYGALANVQTFADGAVSGTTFTSATAGFTPSQSGYGVSIWGAGALLTPPASLSVNSYGATGATSYRYAVSALTATGETTATQYTYASGYASLSTTNYNIFGWFNCPYATGYNIYKSTDGGSTWQRLFTNWQPPATASVRNLSINDTGLTGDTVSLPGGNTAYGVWQGTATYVNATTMTLSSAPTNNVSGAAFKIYHDDTAAINTALSTAASSLATVFVPAGTYTITGTLVQYSGTKLQLDPLAVIQYAPGATGTTMLTNNAYANPVNSSRTGVGITLNANVVTLNTASTADVGKSITIPSAGPGSTPGNLYATITGYVDSTHVLIDQNAFATVTGGTATVSQRDSFIEVTGGKWDKGGVGGTSLNNPSLLFCKVDHLFIHDLQTDGFYASRPISGSDVTDVRIERTYIKSRGGGIQFGGPLNRMTIRTARGKTGDDFAALCAYDYAGVIPTYGNMSYITIEDLMPEVGTTGNGVLLNAGNGTTLSHVTIRNLKGSALRGIFFNEDGASANTTNSRVTNILIDDVDMSVSFLWPTVALQSVYGGNIMIRNVVNGTPYPNGGAGLIRQYSGSTFDTIKIDAPRVPDDSVTNWTPVFHQVAGATVKNLIIDKPDIKTSGSNVTDGVVIGGTVTRLLVSNGVYSQAVAAGSGSYLSITGTVNYYEINGLQMNYGYAPVWLQASATAPKGAIIGAHLYGSFDFARLQVSSDITLSGSRLDYPYYHGFNVQSPAVLTLRGSGNFFDTVNSASRNMLNIQSGGKVKCIGVDYYTLRSQTAAAAGEACMGTTANRPSNLTGNDIGAQYLDTTLNAGGTQIMWNGANWVDYTGATR